jgi:hypothetical protein
MTCCIQNDCLIRLSFTIRDLLWLALVAALAVGWI